jgi:uncharacterized protein (TIGR00255 family)
MIKSMTGFGSYEYSDDKQKVTVEVRSVNHRYCDISLHMPRRYSFAEEKIRAAVKETVCRGKIDINFSIEKLEESDIKIGLNRSIAGQYYEKLLELSDSFDLDGDISLEYLAGLPDVLVAMPMVEDTEGLTRILVHTVKMAVADLDNMRKIEGAKLKEAMENSGSKIRSLLSYIEERAPLVSKEYAEKMCKRIEDLLASSVEIPEDRIATEAAIFADKCSIEEEVTRLKSHIDQMYIILSSEDGPDGKRLDFLVQEMNREANTIGSKANDIGITRKMLDIKNEVENIREQVQNIE